jgi:hydroxypyruvate isomerase
MKFSANLGFLWTDLSLPDAIRAAKAHGFSAVECHWPYATPTAVVLDALRETGLPMLGLNTVRGVSGENGLSALPGRQAEARDAIDQALDYAAAIGAKNIHVMAGYAQGADAHETFVENLIYAARRAAGVDIGILIEPLNSYDAPGYFLTRTDQAVAIIEAVGAANLKLMFDCYHVQLTEGDLTHRLALLQPHIGHVQFASVPDRGPPDKGEINYRHIFSVLHQQGYARPLGAEYRPVGPTGDSLGWLAQFSGIGSE